MEVEVKVNIIFQKKIVYTQLIEIYDTPGMQIKASQLLKFILKQFGCLIINVYVVRSPRHLHNIHFTYKSCLW